MARKKVGLKIRPDSIEENKSILSELKAQNKVDRSSKNLKELFTNLNANNASNDVKNDKNFVAFKNTHEAKGTYGPVPGCPPGSWWGIRVDCSRHGVHKPFNLDIHDGPFGAISICTPQSPDLKDVDLGDFLTLTGREYFEGNSNNESLVLNYQDGVPLRFVRSYSLSNEYSPKTGYRYDGLYLVIAHWIGESENSVKYHKFALKRLPNQEPAPWNQSNAKSSHEPRVEQTKCLPKRLAYTLRKRSPKLKHQSLFSTESEKHNSEKFSQKLCESLSVSQNGIAILTRQVFNKPNASKLIIPSDSQSLRTEPTVRKSYFYKKLGQNQLQNTNISVRTDLYDSFHNVQQEAKRCAAMTFCRIYKPSEMTKEAETPSDEKITSIGNPPADWSRVNNCVLQRKNIVNEKFTNAAADPREETEVLRPASISREAICRIVGFPITNEMDQVDLDRRDSELSDEQENNRSEKCKSIANSTCSDTSNSLDALTPDKILNLVVKEKRNPMAKLLIGNVIGLSIDESKVIKAYNALISKDNKANENVSHQNVDNQSENRLKSTSNFKMLSKRILRHSKNEENRKNYSKLAKRSRGCNDAGQKTGANPKFNDDPGGAIVYSRTVKRKNITEVSKMKKSPACKKQRREIANLVIDAKVGPLIRGPRNRRLRCQSHKGMEKEHDGYIENSAFPRRKGMFNKQSKRSELSKRRKRLKGGITKPRKLLSGNLSRGNRNKTLEVSRNFQEMLTRSSDLQKTTVVQGTKKSRMVDAVAQCSLLSEPLIDSCLQINSEFEHSTDPLLNNDGLSVIKIEEVDLDEIKSENDAEFSEEESVGSYECLNNLERLGNGSREPVHNVCPLVHRESAFVPVNPSSSLKIARLRSIGFRPIQLEPVGDFTDNISRISEAQENLDNVTRKDADEQFNKYTNDESSIVGYMDDDLHYEDIENEERSEINKREKVFLNRVAAPTEYAEMNTPCSIRSVDSNLSSLQSSAKYKDPLSQDLEDNLDRPWHGWRKISSEKGDEWIGW